MTTDLAEFIAGLPKCELHLHLEGTLSPELKLRLAERNGIDIGQSTVGEIEATYEFDSLTSFLMVYYPAMGVLVTAVDFADLAYEYLRKAASQGVRYVEMFFDPQAHTGRGVTFSTVVEGYRQGIVRAHGEFGISAELIMCFLRDLSAEFARARQEGYQLTMHCDIDQVGSVDNIRSALHDIGVDRIDHGTNIVEAPDLVDHVRERGIGLTCCPVSNSFVTSDMKATEIVTLLRDDVKVTVNSDDPAYFKGYMTENFAALADSAQLDAAELVRLTRNAFEIAWLTPRARDGYLAEVDAYAAAHGVA
jgi:adenosine deaminase